LPVKLPVGFGNVIVPRLMVRLPAAFVDTGAPADTPVKAKPFAGTNEPDVPQLNGSISALATEASVMPRNIKPTALTNLIDVPNTRSP
jgi:hypothetical protein